MAGRASAGRHPAVHDFALLGRLTAPMVYRKLFAPSPVQRIASEFPLELAVRPSQIRASAAETALMIPERRGWPGTI